MRLSGTYQATVLEDFKDTIASQNALKLKVRVIPFDNNTDRDRLIDFPYCGYIPPILKDDIIDVIPVNNETENFIFFRWNGGESFSPTGILFEKGSLVVSRETFELSALDGLYTQKVSQNEHNITSETLTVTSSLSGAVIESPTSINLKNSSKDLGSIISGFFQKLMTAQTIGSPVLHTFSPQFIAELGLILVDWNLLTGGSARTSRSHIDTSLFGVSFNPTSFEYSETITLSEVVEKYENEFNEFFNYLGENPQQASVEYYNNIFMDILKRYTLDSWKSVEFIESVQAINPPITPNS